MQRIWLILLVLLVVSCSKNKSYYKNKIEDILLVEISDFTVIKHEDEAGFEQFEIKLKQQEFDSVMQVLDSSRFERLIDNNLYGINKNIGNKEKIAIVINKKEGTIKYTHVVLGNIL